MGWGPTRKWNWKESTQSRAGLICFSFLVSMSCETWHAWSKHQKNCFMIHSVSNFCTSITIFSTSSYFIMCVKVNLNWKLSISIYLIALWIVTWHLERTHLLLIKFWYPRVYSNDIISSCVDVKWVFLYDDNMSSERTFSSSRFSFPTILTEVFFFFRDLHSAQNVPRLKVEKPHDIRFSRSNSSSLTLGGMLWWHKRSHCPKTTGVVHQIDSESFKVVPHFKWLSPKL